MLIFNQFEPLEYACNMLIFTYFGPTKFAFEFGAIIAVGINRFLRCLAIASETESKKKVENFFHYANFVANFEVCNANEAKTQPRKYAY